jgi:hypothetical protein
MLNFRRMSLQLLNTSTGIIPTLYLTEIVSMPTAVKKEIQNLRSSPVCGAMEYVDENGLVTVLILRTVYGSPLGERVLCYMRQRDSGERFLLFSRNAPLILNRGNIHSRTTALQSIEGDPNKFIPEGVIFDYCIILTSFDDERILVISCQDLKFRFTADLYLSVANCTQEKSTVPGYRARSKFQRQPKEVLVVRTDTSEHGMDALETYLPFLGTWTYVGDPRSAFNTRTLVAPLLKHESKKA